MRGFLVLRSITLAGFLFSLAKNNLTIFKHEEQKKRALYQISSLRLLMFANILYKYSYNYECSNRLGIDLGVNRQLQTWVAAPLSSYLQCLDRVQHNPEKI